MIKTSMSANAQRSALDCKPAVKGLASFSLDTAPLCRETAELAERELRETPEQVQNSLAELRNLLKGTFDSGLCVSGGH